MSDPRPYPPMPKGLSRGDLEMNLMVELSIVAWFDVSDQKLDPDALETFMTGWDGEQGDTIVLLSRYDADIKYALVSYRDGKHGSITKDQVAIEWLWDQITAENTQEAS